MNAIQIPRPSSFGFGFGDGLSTSDEDMDAHLGSGSARSTPSLPAYPSSTTTPLSAGEARDTAAPTVRNLFIADAFCACRVFETVLSGRLRTLVRRPTDTERSQLIVSGNVFVYEEQNSGLRRWTDGLHWSPSRIAGNFLRYREMTRQMPAGQRKTNKQRSPGVDDSTTREESPSSSMSRRLSNNREGQARNIREVERDLVGSLVSSASNPLEFKEPAFMKKTMSVKYAGRTFHLVSYYLAPHVESGILQDSNSHPLLRQVIPRIELLTAETLRNPVDIQSYQSFYAGDNRYPLYPTLHPPHPFSNQYPPTHYMSQFTGFQQPIAIAAADFAAHAHSPQYSPNNYHYLGPHQAAQPIYQSSPHYPIAHAPPASSGPTVPLTTSSRPTLPRQPSDIRPISPSSNYISATSPVAGLSARNPGLYIVADQPEFPYQHLPMPLPSAEPVPRLVVPPPLLQPQPQSHLHAYGRHPQINEEELYGHPHRQ